MSIYNKELPTLTQRREMTMFACSVLNPAVFNAMTTPRLMVGPALIGPEASGELSPVTSSYSGDYNDRIFNWDLISQCGESPMHNAMTRVRVFNILMYLNDPNSKPTDEQRAMIRAALLHL